MFQDIDYQALEKKWDGIQKKPFEIHRIILDRSVDAYHRDDSVHNFLTFLKLFPTHKCKFECSVQSLIVFSGVRIRFTGNFLTCQFVYVLFFKISYSIYFRILQSMRKVLSTKSPNFHISFASIRRHRKNRSSTWLFRKVSWMYVCKVYKTLKSSSHFSYVYSQVPMDYTFVQVMDLFFKIHFIFSVPFEPSLIQFCGVFEKYVQ